MTDPAAQTAPPLVVRLVASSSRFAQSAAAEYSDENWDVFYLHLATAVELLIKAVLARAHPSLIADMRGNTPAAFDSLLHLCGMSDRAKTPGSAVRTITATEALARVGPFVNGYRPPSPHVSRLLATRNEIVHGGHRERVEGEAVLGDVARFLDPLLSTLALDANDYWGESAQIVAAHAQRQFDAVEASYSRRIQAAKARYAAVVGRLDGASLAAYVAALSPSPASPPYDSVPADCPACGNIGLVTGSPEPDWEADWDVADGVLYVAGAYVCRIVLWGEAFRCRACGLDLSTEHMALAHLERLTLTEGDYDVSAASQYFERVAAEDNWIDY